MTAPEMMSTEGRSAGGLLIGASVNQAPELFKCAIFGVPFVDVVATMVDCTIPLTCVEWEEWGNPNEEKYFQYMSEYSPTNNVRPGGIYPACLLTGGLHDPRVQFWEVRNSAAPVSTPSQAPPLCYSNSSSLRSSPQKWPRKSVTRWTRRNLGKFA